MSLHKKTACFTRNFRNSCNEKGATRVIVSVFFRISLQIPTAIVAPGGQPSTAMGRSVASYSGHILKLVPGDHQYSLPEFPIVIIWNWFDTFCPTQFVKAGAITNWKLGIITRHLTEAIDIFEEVEEDIKLANKKKTVNSIQKS